jgi:hypothetical protein
MRNGRMYARPVNSGGASGSGAGGSAGASTSTGAAEQQCAPAGGKGKGKAKHTSRPAAPTAASGESPQESGGKGKGRAGGGVPPPGLPSPGCTARPKMPKSTQALHAWERDVAPAVAMGTSPLGRSPCSFGSNCGRWMEAAGAALGTSPGACAGSAPGSGRRAKRNARRAAVDSGTVGSLDFD